MNRPNKSVKTNNIKHIDKSESNIDSTAANNNLEIERKFLIKDLPEEISNNIKSSNYQFHLIEQGYLSTNPVVRARRQGDEYILTYKSSGMLSRIEYNLPLTQESYDHLIKKTDGNIITKTRYLIPFKGDNQGKFLIELDIFEGKFRGLILAEVEFETEEIAKKFIPPSWFIEDVTYKKEYHNSTMSKM